MLQFLTTIRKLIARIEAIEEPVPRFIISVAFQVIRYTLVTVLLGIIVILTPFLLAFSLLPMTPLLLLIQAILPDETVLSETKARTIVPFDLDKRVISVIICGLVFVALTLVGIELLRYVPLPSSNPMMTQLADSAAGLPVSKYFPSHAVVNWPLVGLLIYVIDFLILAFLLRVPLAYNYRNLVVRWWVTLLVAGSFTVVIFVVTIALAFVNGMYTLTESTGQKGNIIILADGATDEQFSSMAYSDVTNVQEKTAIMDENDQPLPSQMPVVRVASRMVGDRRVFLLSRETLIFVNQPRAVAQGVKRRRFIQMRGIVDPLIAEEVHNIRLTDDSRWFCEAGVNGSHEVECVLGEGIAAQLGEDAGKPTLETGDTFQMSDRTWRVVGIMKSEGSTFSSEVWAKQALVGPMFNKNAYSTLVLRAEPDNQDAARVLAYHLRTRESPKMNATTEVEYYSKLQETNKQFLYAILAVAIIMAIGGVFGVMVAMFAAITRRTKDIGIMRILGFKRWQLLVSFLLESLAIAVFGGVMGVFFAWLLADGKQASSIVSSGQGGGKTVALTLNVDGYIILTGLLFALIMGRIGGLIPALTTLRLKILDALKT